MIGAKLWVLVPLGVLGVLFSVLWMRGLVHDGPLPRPSVREILIGALTDFLDTLGIGSFATTTSLYRALGIVPDRLLPGTLNVGHTLPTIAQALIYIVIIEVDLLTLVAMIGAAVLGALLGAGVVARWSERNVRIGMGLALLAAALLILCRLLDVLPAGGDARALTGARLVFGVLGSAVLGALMTIGIGLYAPCMILVSLLGMSPTVAFPIMMGSCAFLMPAASARFVQRRAYVPSAALGLAFGGVPAVIVAAYLVKSLPLDAVRWLVLSIVLYTAANLLRAGLRAR